MNRKYSTVLLAAGCFVMVFGFCSRSEAIPQKPRGRWMQGMAGADAGRRPRPEMVIERIMDRLRRSDPNRAEELAQLREKDPEKFNKEISRLTQQQQRRKRWTQPEGFGFGKGPGAKGFRAPAGHLEWIEKNYPEEARKLTELKGKRPRLYRRRLALASKRYKRIQEVQKDNPELAEALKADLALRSGRAELLRKIKAAATADEKEHLTEELEQVVGERFDLIVKRKQMRYQQLRKGLDNLIEQVSTSEAMLDKYKDRRFKKEHVKQRVKALTSGKEPFKWD